MELLRFITCGSVDDGKSTLIGRLLHDCGALPDDQLGDGSIDYANLLDGLAAEREQGITIDVAYRYFSSARRSYIVADTPGHEQYTRNMVTGASTADLAVVLVDARKGVLTQTRRHSFLAHLLGIRLDCQVDIPSVGRVDFVVTEHGVAALRGCSLGERARRMIAVAAPEHRATLEFDLEEYDLASAAE